MPLDPCDSREKTQVWKLEKDQWSDGEKVRMCGRLGRHTATLVMLATGTRAGRNPCVRWTAMLCQCRVPDWSKQAQPFGVWWAESLYTSGGGKSFFVLST